jgi:hypothetical protein
MSRAQALSIIIGHPVALEADIYGRQLLLKCLRKGRYCGVALGASILRAAGLDLTSSSKNASETTLGGVLSESMGTFVDHLTELSLAYGGNNEEDEEDDEILLQPTDFSAFYSGNQAFRNYLS